jgi:ribosome-interacting GTPase 1
MSNCDVAIREPGCNIEDLIDVIEGNRVYVPAIYVLNKVRKDVRLGLMCMLKLLA